MRNHLGNATTRLVALVRGLALPPDPPSADPDDVQQQLSEQASRLQALAAGASRRPCRTPDPPWDATVSASAKSSA